MKHRCPSCKERLDKSSRELQVAGGWLQCASCGYGWLEGRAIEIAAEPLPAVSGVINKSGDPEAEIHTLMSASRQAQEFFLLQRRRRLTAAAVWIGLATLALSPIAIAAAMPEAVVAAAPATIGLYDRLGREVNIYGLEIKDVNLQHLYVGNQKVIAIKGEVVNVSDSERKIPWLRFGLKSGDSVEVYHWQLDTASRPLRPGEAKSFLTRIASPPETARSVEIRFAHADEIGSNSFP